MLFLRTGLPGAGKTLNTIKEIDEEHAVDPENPELRLHKDPEHPDAPPRTIYYNGIPDLKTDQLKARWVEWETPEKWFELPDGCVIVIDEAQGTFGTDIGRARVEKVTRFEKHRHHGWDIHLITQHPSLLAPAVRKLVGKHLNFIRPYGRTKGVFRHEYEMCIDSPEKRVNFKMAQESKITFDPHYFGLYKSATVHTHKKITPNFVKMLPLYIAATVLPLLLLGGGAWWFVASAEEDKASLRAKLDQPDETLQPETQQASSVRQRSSSSEPEETGFLEARLPRVEDLPLSAPRYDDVAKPRDFPRPVCAATYDGRLIDTAKKRGQQTGYYRETLAACQCYTQQITKMETTFQFCMDVVTNGYFDDTRLVPTYATGNSSRGLTTSPSATPAAAFDRGRAASSQQPVNSSGANLTVVNSGKPGLLW